MFVKVENGAVTQEITGGYQFSDRKVADLAAWYDGNEAFCASEGVFLLVENKPAFNATYEELVFVDYTIGQDSVTKNYAKQDQNLAALKLTRQAAVNELRNTALDAGFVYNGTAYDTAPPSLNNITGAAARIGLETDPLLAPNIIWRSADNTNHEFTATEFKAFAIAAYDYANNVYQNSFIHKDAIEALSTAQEVAQYDITTGW